MSMMRRFVFALLLAPFLCALSLAGAQAAPTCQATLPSSLNFGGDIDILSGNSVETSAPVVISCSGVGAAETVRFCIAPGAGSVNDYNYTLYINNTAGNRLYYALFFDGEVFTSTTAKSVYVNLNQATPRAVIYLRTLLAANQKSRPVGSYGGTVSFNLFYATYSNSATPNDCDFVAVASSSASVSLGATVTPNCKVKAAAVTFAQTNVLAADLNALGAVTVTCTTNAPYWIALDDGVNSLSGQRRMKSGGDYIDYDLYSNSARTVRWGGTKDVDVITGTGNSSGQEASVYAKIPRPAVPPPPGTYSDTVTATVNF